MPFHDGQHGPLYLLDHLDRSRGRGWFHRFVVWLCGRPARDRRPW